MISQELNDQLTRVGPNSDAGAVLRQYWQPAALTDELKNGEPVPVNLLGERLALVCDDAGDWQLVTRRANADEHPTNHPQTVVADPDGPVYRVQEKRGIVFAWLGQGDVPAFPNFDCFRAPGTHVFAFKGLWQCNWLQAFEIGIDPAHASFLHRFLEDEDPDDSYGKQFRDKAADTDIPMTRILREYPRPEITVDETDYGLKITALRHMENEKTHVRITNAIFPETICIPMSREMTITQWHVPVDDENCYWYTLFTSFDKPVNKELMREQRLKEHTLPEYAPIKNKTNDYCYDPLEQQSSTYTGMGLDINVHDQWAVEMMGSIQDRTREHLGRSDVAIIRNRRMLRKAISALADGNNDALLMQSNAAEKIIGPLSNDAIANTEEWQNASVSSDIARRAECPWDATV